MPGSPPSLADTSVLAAFGHPDDEGFGCGGLLALLADGGARITMVCATNGDVGEISDPGLATPQNLGQVRREEMRRAMAVTGITDVRFLGYRDSGMDGTDDNDHPDSLLQAEPGRVVAQVVQVIRETRPDVVLTHDPTGGYGHPDHITIHNHVTQAFSLAADPGYQPDPDAASSPWQPRLLYWVCFPRSNFRRWWRQMQDAGITPPFASQEIDTIGTPDELVTTVVNVAAYLDVKMASLRCHRTQLNPNGAFSQMPEHLLRESMSSEYFGLAAPEGAGKDADLLAGL